MVAATSLLVASAIDEDADGEEGGGGGAFGTDYVEVKAVPAVVNERSAREHWHLTRCTSRNSANDEKPRRSAFAALTRSVRKPSRPIQTRGRTDCTPSPRGSHRRTKCSTSADDAGEGPQREVGQRERRGKLLRAVMVSVAQGKSCEWEKRKADPLG